jgi:glutamyl-tRNA reductase
VAALRVRANEIAEQVVHENDGKWDTASERDLERVDAVARAIVNRLLHEPTLQMREMRDDRVHARMALVRELFGLSADEPALDAGEQQSLAEIRELPRSVHARSSRRG